MVLTSVGVSFLVHYTIPIVSLHSMLMLMALTLISMCSMHVSIL